MFGGGKSGRSGGFFVWKPSGSGNKGPSKKQQGRAWTSMTKKRNQEEQQPTASKKLQELTDDDDNDHDDKKSTGVMMSVDSPIQSSIPTLNYVELPEEPRPGKITPNKNSSSSNSTPSPLATKSDSTTTNHRSSPEAGDEDEVIEEAVPIVRTTLPSPEPRPTIEHNGHAEHDRVDGNGSLKPPKDYEPPRDVDEDSCLIKCVYFTQQCCECTIV